MRSPYMTPAAGRKQVILLGGQRAGWRIRLRHPRDFSRWERWCAAQIQAHLESFESVPAGGSPEGSSLARVHPPALTPREADVLHLIRLGKRNREIAAILGVAARTVGKHVENILRKLGAETRGAAARAADDWHAQDRGPQP